MPHATINALILTNGKAMNMKTQPSIEQVMALDGRIFAMLNLDEVAVLNFYREQGRRYGVSVSIINEADPEELEQASSRQQADHILKSANSRVCVTFEASKKLQEGHPATFIAACRTGKTFF